MSRETILHCLAITTVAATLFFTSLGKARLWDRDEPRNAGCAAEMLERGDWITPIFNAELRHQKPVLLYWLMMASYTLLGVNEFAARMPSALLAIGTALLTYGIARRLFDSSVALLASLALSSSIMFCVAARAATPDSLLIFFSTLGMYFYVTGTFSPKSNHSAATLRSDGHWFPQSITYVVLMNAAFGLAVLAKGPIGLIVPTAIIGMFLLIQRLDQLPAQPGLQGRLRGVVVSLLRIINPIHFFQTCWYMRPLTAIGIVVLISAPWYIAAHIQTNGDFTNLFFFNENFARATTVMENHNGSWLYYPATLAIGFFPWSIFLGPVLFAIHHQVSRRSENAPAITLLACWVAVQVGLFSLAETKLPSYISPCYPAMAMLTSFCVIRWLPSLANQGIRWQYAAHGTFVLAGAATCVGLNIAATKLFSEIWWIAALGLIPMIGGLIAIYLHHCGKGHIALTATTLSAILFCLFMFGVGTVAVDSTRTTNVLFDEIKETPAETKLATYHCLESSWVIYAERPIFELHRGAKSAEVPSSLDREHGWKKKPVVTPEDFVSSNPEAMFLTTDEHAQELLARLPERFAIRNQTDFFLKEDRKLVLIAPANSSALQTASSTAASVR